MATIPEAKLLVISSPYAKCGVLFEAHHNHFGKDDSLVLVWQAPTTVMNPSITQEFIDQEMANDPDAGRGGCAELYGVSWGDNSEEEGGGYVSQTGRRRKFPSMD